MREIRFRIWDKLDGHMYYSGFEINFVGQIIRTYGIYKTAIHLELMQFTGLHDKNGKEIWEGDIINQVVKRGVWEYHQPVTYQEHLAQFRFGTFATTDLVAIEVIGNIYENPELIKENP